jgi:flagellar protein FlaG
MDITGVNRSVHALPATATVIPVEKAAEHREIVQAVKAINGAEMFGPENELLYQRDARTQRFVLRVVNRKTNEVIAQVPSEYALRLASEVRPAVGR